ncbi:MAG TPA: Z1 domain-containing protein, partial [Iamia sp.]|nr:Z1 domain-containing protein [Iamia sp.]
FGSEELFGLDENSEEEGGRSPHDMIREVSVQEAAEHAVRRGEPLSPSVTPALADAIRWFILATAARRYRSGEVRHSSMLVHTTMRVDPQLAYLQPIRQHLRELADQWERGQTGPWANQWAEEQARESPGRHGLESVSFEELSTVIPAVLDGARVVADNSRSTERLLYSDEPATVIAVGGNTLSRGLTLEGLVSSYFLRSSGTYDSLLQMGRWFGYRPGYADLPRIWTTVGLADDFRFLAEIEMGLRVEIERIRVEGATPRHLPVRIRAHPRMQITAKSKMQFAVPGEASYSGQRPQTTYFHHRSDDVARNRATAETLVRTARAHGASVDAQDGRVLLEGVPVEDVLAFVDEYRFHPDTDLRSDLLRRYIEGQVAHGALDVWNIAVITRRPPAESLDLGLDDPVNLITRSQLKSNPDPTTANIGTLMSRPDRVIDLLSSAESAELPDHELLDARSASGRALLLLYPIDKGSQPRPSAAHHREALDAVGHIVAAAFSFPRAVPDSEPVDMIQVDPVLLAAPDELPDPAEADEYVDEEGDHDEIDLGDG